ncbi:tetratricopeptide repeat protein [Streptomyces olivoreticuli]|nr:tetratricopeptide repeat protein [Streptomyces olivoreticuli]WKK27767.1 tetratricopeptide repeat protein [Streptomyces olivoreticuli]
MANRLAGCLVGLRKYEEARDLFADILPRCGRTLGEAHPQTLTVASNLCACLTALGAHQDARARWRWDPVSRVTALPGQEISSRARRSCSSFGGSR